jgi:hypothetical protein
LPFAIICYQLACSAFWFKPFTETWLPKSQSTNHHLPYIQTNLTNAVIQYITTNKPNIQTCSGVKRYCGSSFRFNFSNTRCPGKTKIHLIWPCYKQIEHSLSHVMPSPHLKYASSTEMPILRINLNYTDTKTFLQYEYCIALLHLNKCQNYILYQWTYYSYITKGHTTFFDKFTWDAYH